MSDMSAACSNIVPNFPTECPEPGSFRPQKVFVEIKSVFCLGVQTCIVLQDRAQSTVWLQHPPPEWMRRGAMARLDFDRFGNSQISLAENATNH
jgi:hypothetical protein